MPLAGKAIVITGAGRGVGRACAVLAARLGASVVVNDIDGDLARETAEAIGDAAVADASDVSTWAGAGAMIDGCVERFGRIDGLVNNAALCTPCHLEQTDEAFWRATIETNVLGVAFATTLAVRRMLNSGGGAIVNMTSAAHLGATNLVPYGSSKGAVASFTYCAALDLAPRGIRVNAVSPFAATRMIDASLAFGAASGQIDPSLLPTPEDNAPVTCFLLSDDSRDFNGQIIRVERDGLSMIGHPVVLAPHPTVATDDYDAVRDALRTRLAAQMQPIGIHRATVDFL